MTGLDELEALLDSFEQQQIQNTTLYNKAMQQEQAQQELSPDVQGIINNVMQQREREAVRRRLANFYNEVEYACGGCIKHADGGSIHIDPSKKGTFTAAASRHGMGVQEFASRVLAHKENYSPAMVKKANFARNATKFHHAYGGPINIFAHGGSMSHQDGKIKSILDKYLTNYRITSGYRGKNNKIGKLGSKSAHAHLLDDGSSAALDIVSDNMDRLRQELTNPELQRELAANGFGILDETDPATMKRTGATGAHFHIGQGIKGGGFHINGYGHQPADIAYPSYASGPMQPIVTSSGSDDTSSPSWWDRPSAMTEADTEALYASAAGAGGVPTQDFSVFNLDWNPNMFAKGGEVKRSDGNKMWNKAKPLYAELTAAGVPHMAAIGVLGNIALESGVNPNAKNSVNGGHWGYVQNDKVITDHIKKYYGGYGHAEQMQFLKDGLTGKIRGAKQAPWLQKRFDEYRRHMNGVTDPAQAALLWERDYEKSKNEGLNQRSGYAKHFHTLLGSPATDYVNKPSVSEAQRYIDMLQPIVVGGNTEQPQFNPWWSQNTPEVEAEATQYANLVPDFSQFNLSWDPINGRKQRGLSVGLMG